MFIPTKLKEESVYKEGIVVGLIFLLSGLIFFILNTIIPALWLVIFGLLLIALALVILFLAFFIPFFSGKKSDLLLFIWSEILYLFIGIPIASICILIIPVSIYLLFFAGGVQEIINFSLIFILSLQLSSLIYSGVKIWFENRSSGHPLPSKVDRGPIEQLLEEVPTYED